MEDETKQVEISTGKAEKEVGENASGEKRVMNERVGRPFLL